MTRTGSLSPNLDEPRGKNNQDASFHFRHFSLVIMNSQLFSVGQQGCTGNYHQFGMRSSCTRWDSTITKQQVLLEYTIATRRANQFESDCWSNVENQLISIVGQWKGGRLSHKAKKLAFFIHTTSEKLWQAWFKFLCTDIMRPIKLGNRSRLHFTHSILDPH